MNAHVEPPEPPEQELARRDGCRMIAAFMLVLWIVGMGLIDRYWLHWSH